MSWRNSGNKRAWRCLSTAGPRRFSSHSLFIFLSFFSCLSSLTHVGPFITHFFCKSSSACGNRQHRKIRDCLSTVDGHQRPPYHHDVVTSAKTQNVKAHFSFPFPFPRSQVYREGIIQRTSVLLLCFFSTPILNFIIRSLGDWAVVG